MASARDDRVYTPHSPFAAATPLKEKDLLSHSEILQTITKRIRQAKEPVEANSLVAYEFLEEAKGEWRWSIGQVKEFTPHSVTIQKWRCERGGNHDLVDALRRDQVVKTKQLKDYSQSIFALRAELGAVRNKNETQMARVRSELEERQRPLSIADDGVWTSVLRTAGSGKAEARGVMLLVTAVVRLVDQRSTTQALAWGDVSASAQQSTFLDRLYRYDVWYDMSTEQFECAKGLLEDHSDLQPSTFDRAVHSLSLNSETQSYIESLYMWLKAQVQAFTTYLECASTQEYANSLQQQLFDCVQSLKELNRKLGQIKEQLSAYSSGSTGIAESMDSKGSYTFVPTHGIYATLLRSSLIIPLRDKSTEVVVLGKEDVAELLDAAEHHRPNLHLLIGDLLQTSGGAGGEFGGSKEDLESAKRRIAELQAENEALREEVASDTRNKQRNATREPDSEPTNSGDEKGERDRLKEENKKLKDDLRKAEKENQKLKDDLRKAEKENQKLKDDLRKAERDRNEPSVSRRRGGEDDSRQLREDLQEAKKEIRKLKDDLREAERAKRRTESSRSSSATDDALRKVKDENKVLRREKRELEDALRQAERQARRASISSSVSAPPRDSALRQLLLEEKCSRLKIENSAAQRWSSLIAFDRRVLIECGEAQTLQLLQELDALSSDYTDSLEKLEELMQFVEEARGNEKKLRDRLIKRENELFSLQQQLDSIHISGYQPESGMSTMRAGAHQPSQEFSSNHRQTSRYENGSDGIGEQLRNLKRENEELLRAVQLASASSHRASPHGQANNQEFTEIFMRLRGEIEALKREREALREELVDRNREIEMLSRDAADHMNDLNAKIEGGQRSAQRMKAMIRDMLELRNRKRGHSAVPLAAAENRGNYPYRD